MQTGISLHGVISKEQIDTDLVLLVLLHTMKKERYVLLISDQKQKKGIDWICCAWCAVGQEKSLLTCKENN